MWIFRSCANGPHGVLLNKVGRRVSRDLSTQKFLVPMIGYLLHTKIGMLICLQNRGRTQIMVNVFSLPL